MGTPTSGRLHRPVASSPPSQPYQVDVQRMFDGVPDGARDRPPLPVKRGGGAAEPLGMLVTSAQRESFLVGSFMQLPHRGPAPSGSPCWATVFAGRGGGCRLLCVPTLDLYPCGVPRAPSPLACSLRVPSPHLLGVTPVYARVVCGVWCVCGRTSPECAAAAQCPRVRAPSAVHQRLREFTLRSPIRSFGSRLSICPCAGGRRGSLHVLSPVLPTPHRAPSPHWWVCVWSRV